MDPDNDVSQGLDESWRVLLGVNRIARRVKCGRKVLLSQSAYDEWMPWRGMDHGGKDQCVGLDSGSTEMCYRFLMLDSVLTCRVASSLLPISSRV